MLEIKKIYKKYTEFALKNISFKVDQGEYVVLLGQSGAGKSLILEMIAGLIHPDQGEILLNQKNITVEKIQNRNIGMVFQDNTVFPHLTVRNNIAYALKYRNIDKASIAQRINHLAKKTGILHLMDRWPETLSGGELQRVAISRTLALEPSCLLLDEPLASLDVQLRDELRSLLREINQEGITIIHVTHDFEEAIALADQVGIIHQGELVQFGSPKEVFHKPKSKFIAHFTGVKNFYHADIKTGRSLVLDNKVEVKHALENSKGQGFVMFKSEDVILSKTMMDSSITNNFEGRVLDMIPTSRGMEVIIDIGVKVSALITQESFEKYQLSKQSTIWIGIKATALHFIEKE